MPSLSVEEAERYRAIVRQRLSRRNVMVAVAFVVVGLVTVVGAICSGRTGHWLIVFFLTGLVAWVLWEVHAYRHPRAVCPQCGDRWEYDGFLGQTACETCGLGLPREKP